MAEPVTSPRLSTRSTSNGRIAIPGSNVQEVLTSCLDQLRQTRSKYWACTIEATNQRLTELSGGHINRFAVIAQLTQQVRNFSTDRLERVLATLAKIGGQEAFGSSEQTESAGRRSRSLSETISNSIERVISPRFAGSYPPQPDSGSMPAPSFFSTEFQGVVESELMGRKRTGEQWLSSETLLLQTSEGSHLRKGLLAYLARIGAREDVGQLLLLDQLITLLSLEESADRLAYQIALRAYLRLLEADRYSHALFEALHPATPWDVRPFQEEVASLFDHLSSQHLREEFAQSPELWDTVTLVRTGQHAPEIVELQKRKSTIRIKPIALTPPTVEAFTSQFRTTVSAALLSALGGELYNRATNEKIVETFFDSALLYQPTVQKSWGQLLSVKESLRERALKKRGISEASLALYQELSQATAPHTCGRLIVGHMARVSALGVADSASSAFLAQLGNTEWQVSLQKEIVQWLAAMHPFHLHSWSPSPSSISIGEIQERELQRTFCEEEQIIVAKVTIGDELFTPDRYSAYSTGKEKRSHLFADLRRALQKMTDGETQRLLLAASFVNYRNCDQVLKERLPELSKANESSKYSLLTDKAHNLEVSYKERDGHIIVTQLKRFQIEIPTKSEPYIAVVARLAISFDTIFAPNLEVVGYSADLPEAVQFTERANPVMQREILWILAKSLLQS